MAFAVSADHMVKLKESEKKDKYIDLARVLIPIVIGLLGRVTKGLVKEMADLEIGRIGTTQTPAFLISARILRRVQETHLYIV